MKTNHEILEIGLENFDEFFYTGLCGLFSVGTDFGLTQEECDKIKRYIWMNPTDDFSTWKLNKNINIPNYMGVGYWFLIGKREPRIEWLKKHIKLTK